MPDVSRHHFHFHAHAQALGGKFHHPLSVVIPTQATASLPTVGGEATTEARHFHFQDFLHFEHAHTHISGRHHKDGAFVTHATTTVKGLNVLGKVTFDRIVSRLTSVHQPDEVEGHITAADSHFHGFRIHGKEFKVTLRHNLLVDGRTYAHLADAIKANPKYGRIHPDPNRKVALCTLVETIEAPLQPALTDVKVAGNVITIDNFGKLFLAEVYAEPGTRTLTMLRLQLGSPHIASVAVAESVTNGQQGPPTIAGGG
jgi:hypothetical protein